MNIIEKYAYYKAGIVKGNVSEKEQLFFKTFPSETQINLLNDIAYRNNFMWTISLICYLILGGVLGFVLAYFQFVIAPALKLLGIGA